MKMPVSLSDKRTPGQTRFLGDAWIAEMNAFRIGDCRQRGGGPYGKARADTQAQETRSPVPWESIHGRFHLLLSW